VTKNAMPHEDEPLTANLQKVIPEGLDGASTPTMKKNRNPISQSSSPRGQISFVKNTAANGTAHTNQIQPAPSTGRNQIENNPSSSKEDGNTYQNHL